MKPARFAYRRAGSLAEAVTLAAEAQGFAKFVAGGQTLGPMLNLRLVQPDLLIDIARIEVLRGVGEEAGRLRLGGGVTHAAIEDGAVPGPLGARLARIAGGIAYRSVRNRGTLGGSLAHADPSAEWPSVMLALDAEVAVQGAEGSRTLGIGNLLEGAMTTSLEASEIVEAVHVPAGARLGCSKLCRKVGEFASALGVVARMPDGGVRAVVGALDGAPQLLPETGRFLAGIAGWSPSVAEGLAILVEGELTASGACTDADRRAVHAVTLVRAAAEVFAE